MYRYDTEIFMTRELQTVGPLKRVTVAFKNREEAEAFDSVSFIFGIGKNGLTPFERRLEGQPAGSGFEMVLDKTTLQQWFDHLKPALPDFSGMAGSFTLEVSVEEIAPATGREVVRAMAAQVEGCGCGCGCEGHGMASTNCGAGGCSAGDCRHDGS